jgi:hypothetical protein
MRHRLIFRLRDHRLWPVAAGVLVLALLWTQTLGLLHGIAHGPHGAGAPRSVVHVHDDTEHSHATHPAHAHVAALFDTHDDESAECRLYDQLTHGDLLWSAIAAFAPSVPPAARARCATPAPLPAAAGWFYARGPPQRA